MEHKMIKYSFIIITISIIVIIAILVILTRQIAKSDANGYILDKENDIILEKEERVHLVMNESMYFSVKEIMQKYVKYIEKANSQVVYNMLSSEYKEQNNITISNCIEKLPSYHIPELIVKHMYMKEGDIVDYLYLEVAIQNNKINTNNQLIVTEQKEYYKLGIDKENSSFAIEPIDLIYYQEYIENKQVVETRIEKNSNNSMSYKNVTENDVVSEYLNNYCNLLQYNIEQAYTLLQEEYKEEKYKTYSDFETYVKNNDITEGMILKSYTKQYNEDKSIEYICKDEYGRTYLFKTMAVLEYTVQLDDYTLENKAFNQKYEKANSRDKGILNIDKFFEMINRQDYTAAYALLDANFKQNYFKTQVEFENYMKNKVFRYNSVNYKEYSNQITDIYIYKITLTDATKQSSQEIEFNIVMKLLEGTNFVMSFDVN